MHPDFASCLAYQLLRRRARRRGDWLRLVSSAASLPFPHSVLSSPSPSHVKPRNNKMSSMGREKEAPDPDSSPPFFAASVDDARRRHVAQSTISTRPLHPWESPLIDVFHFAFRPLPVCAKRQHCNVLRLLLFARCAPCQYSSPACHQDRYPSDLGCHPSYHTLAD